MCLAEGKSQCNSQPTGVYSNMVGVYLHYFIDPEQAGEHQKVREPSHGPSPVSIPFLDPIFLRLLPESEVALIERVKREL